MTVANASKPPAPVGSTTCPRCDGPADSLALFDGPIGEPYELVRCQKCGRQERIAKVAKPLRYPKVPPGIMARPRKRRVAG